MRSFGSDSSAMGLAVGLNPLNGALMATDDVSSDAGLVDLIFCPPPRFGMDWTASVTSSKSSSAAAAAAVVVDITRRLEVDVDGARVRLMDGFRPVFVFSPPVDSTATGFSVVVVVVVVVVALVVLAFLVVVVMGSSVVDSSVITEDDSVSTKS